MLDISGWAEFKDEMINMPATALAKCQLRMVGLRKLLSSPGEDPEWDEAGNEKIPGTGEAGQMSRIVHIASFKDSIGPNFRTALQITPNMRVLDLPLSTMTRLGLRFPGLQYEREDLTKVGQ